METNCSLANRSHDPFDDSAVERQRRMGLLVESGGVDETTVAVLSRVYAGLFLDNLCDSYPSMEAVFPTCHGLVELARNSAPRRALLELCMIYDGMHRPLPEPIWWIVGNDALLAPFMSGFAARLSELSSGLEVMQ